MPGFSGFFTVRANILPCPTRSSERIPRISSLIFGYHTTCLWTTIISPNTGTSLPQSLVCSCPMVTMSMVIIGIYLHIRYVEVRLCIGPKRKCVICAVVSSGLEYGKVKCTFTCSSPILIIRTDTVERSQRFF